MALIHIDRRYLSRVWGDVAPILQRAVELEPAAGTIDQLQLLIRQGMTNLLVWEEDDVIEGACLIEFIDAANHRIAHVSHMAGEGVVRAHVFEEAQQWMRSNGADIAQCWAKGSLVQMYEKMGLTNTHQVMRMAL
jgi:hypothetical protein